MLNSVRLKVFEFTKMEKTSLLGNMKTKQPPVGSPIMKSIDPNINNKPEYNNACGDKLPEGLMSLDVTADIDDEYKSTLLLDDNENLRIHSEEEFLKALNIPPNEKVKVVSIFGNTGDGKSYTLNKVFFDGEEVFKTSSSQDSCTLGVWAMYNAKMKVIFVDTEGFLGISKREHQRTRLLLKVLAISDIIIYRTRAERIQRDMYTFLGGASKAYKDHFSSALRKALNKADAQQFAGALGPGVIIFHETRHTDTLHVKSNVTQSTEDILRADFAALGLSYDAFSFIKYIGVQTEGPETNFKDLKVAVLDKLDSTEIRTMRDAKYIYLTLKSLNDKFQTDIQDSTAPLYLPAFFTCTEKCQSCKTNCSLSMGHKEEGEPHQSTQDCTFQHQYQNYVYLCKACYKNGHRSVVKPSYQTMTDNSWSSYLNYVWAGYVIECPKCGEIFRSRQHWYGNKNPEDAAVRAEVVHMWPGERSLFGSLNSAQKVLDGVSMFTDVISHVGSQPKKLLSDWAADKIAPSYWRPNHEIKVCFLCKIPFLPHAKKHHCRSCGEGFCDGCSSKRQPVPAKGWLEDVRVCDSCYSDQPPTLSNMGDPSENRARQIGETVISTISAVTSVLDIPKEYIKESARPTYWTPDNECIECWVCKKQFGPLRPLHHCRECGRGVCNDCSGSRKAVPSKGWDSPVRVCSKCR
ncbi:zinc finger FYVE domain-containing protein 1 isoform X2 [Diabrotica virgifera virgifera]|uniref:Zinc finger FYVE domain-containing protein 1-like isoform X3 n=1 Tax=Diabrotica virgifera virgifera TaxID=50390 RepID=A0A6P7FC99_DIAVI|nr:zinc finger FYVE domain-containing protein 1 isoform X2 [Diabrotica virgifera virgifera]